MQSDPPGCDPGDHFAGKERTMEKRENRGLIGTIFGGLSMGWGRVLLLAVAAAALTAVFLILPVFRNSSFERMGVYLEAWIFFAVLIMSNCKKPLESAGKTFVFFLISQPLIYLFQVPFSALGWGLFQFYRYWFILTLLTFPGAFLGWYVTKRNWWSVLILAPVLAYLGIVAWDCGQSCLRQFPRLLVTVLFCLLQIGLYLAAFCPGRKRWAALAVPVLAAAVFALSVPAVNVDSALFLPGDPILTEAAAVELEDEVFQVTIERTGEDSMVRVKAQSFGGTDFTIRDGETEYRYALKVYEDETGHTQIRITEADGD